VLLEASRWDAVVLANVAGEVLARREFNVSSMRQFLEVTMQTGDAVEVFAAQGAAGFPGGKVAKLFFSLQPR
jgi:6-phosphogluconolactonase (cycloisomerase 2 family)